jgi:hypothetical protein
MMDLRVSTELGAADTTGPAQAVLAEVTCTWSHDMNAPEQATAVVVHAAREMLVLEASNPRQVLPALGTLIQVTGDIEHVTGRLAEEGRAGRFLISLGDRPVRSVLRLRVSLAGTLRSTTLPEPVVVEIVDLTTGGARLRGVALPAGSQVTFDFTPPGRDESVTVRALVAHSSSQAEQPWIGVLFRLVAMRGGRQDGAVSPQ